MPITRTPMIDDDGTGTTGTIINNAWKQEFYNQIDAVVPSGVWIDTPFSASNFRGSGSMIWTVASGSQLTCAHMVLGKTVLFTFVINGTTVGGTVDIWLQLRLPGGYVPTRTIDASTWAIDATVGRPVRLRLFAGDAWISLQRLDGLNWTAGAGATTVAGQVLFSIA